MSALLLLAGRAWACAVCGAGQSNDQTAYLAMTGFLSLLPLAMMGGVAWWIHQAMRTSASRA